MIGRKQLGRAVTENDRAGGKNLDLTLAELGFGPHGEIEHVAMQRALRLYSVLRGSEFAAMRASDLDDLTASERGFIMAMAAAWIDGLAAAARAKS